jgi:hypothetical protein
MEPHPRTFPERSNDCVPQPRIALSKSALTTLDFPQLTKRLQDGDYTPVLLSNLQSDVKNGTETRASYSNDYENQHSKPMQSCPMEQFLSAYRTVYSRETISDLSRKITCLRSLHGGCRVRVQQFQR